MARAKITGVFRVSYKKGMYVVFCNQEIFDGWLGDKGMQLVTAMDEFDAFKKGKDFVDEWNERDKAQRQAVRREAKQAKSKGE